MNLKVCFALSAAIVSASIAFGQVASTPQAASPAPPIAPLPPPKFRQSELPPGAKTSVDAAGRKIVGTDAQRMYLLDPDKGAVGAGSHRPSLINPQQLAGAEAKWKTLSSDEKKKAMAELGSKIQAAHANYIRTHPEQAHETAQSAKLKPKGTVEVPLHGVKLRFPVDGREVDVPVGFRDNSGRRMIKTPAQVASRAGSNGPAASIQHEIPLPSVQAARAGSWHKLQAVMKKNSNTGEHLVFLRTGFGQSGGVGGSCPPSCPPTDTDGDGIPDGLEASLGSSFTPTYHVSNYEQPATGFAIMQDSPPENVQTSYGPTPPISYYRVEPSNFIDSGTDGSGNTVYHRYLRIDYLTLWNEDDGLAHGLTCDLAVGGDLGVSINFLAGVLGFDIAGETASLGGHYLDNEHSAVLLAVQVSGPYDMTLPSDYTQYAAVRYFNAAHEHTIFDGSEYFTPSSPVGHDTHIDLYLSQSKHSTYFYNPDRKPILITRDELNYIEAAIIPITAITVFYDYYDECPTDPDSYYIVLPDGEVYFGIDNYDGSCYLPDYSIDYAYLAEAEALTEEVFADCLAEHFTDLGPMLASQQINVGEPSNPSSGNHFILDTTPDYAGSKLTEAIFPDKSL